MFYLPLYLFNFISLLLPLHNFYYFPSSTSTSSFILYIFFGSTTQYNMNRKNIRFTLAVSAEHRRYNNTLYNILYYIQICGVRTRTELSDSLHRILSERRPEKTCQKKTSVRKKTPQEIWVGSMAHALKSPSNEGYTAGMTLPLFTKQVFQQRTANCK